MCSCVVVCSMCNWMYDDEVVYVSAFVLRNKMPSAVKFYYNEQEARRVNLTLNSLSDSTKGQDTC